jgi:hypothetical protein
VWGGKGNPHAPAQTTQGATNRDSRLDVLLSTSYRGGNNCPLSFSAATLKTGKQRSSNSRLDTRDA